MATQWNEEVCNSLDTSTEAGRTQYAAAGCGQPEYRAETAALSIINVALAVVAFVAVAFIIVGGVQYATSAGDPSKAVRAKNTIMYAVIGLVVALLSFAIANFVINNIA